MSGISSADSVQSVFFRQPDTWQVQDATSVPEVLHLFAEMSDSDLRNVSTEVAVAAIKQLGLLCDGPADIAATHGGSTWRYLLARVLERCYQDKIYPEFLCSALFAMSACNQGGAVVAALLDIAHPELVQRADWDEDELTPSLHELVGVLWASARV